MKRHWADDWAGRPYTRPAEKRGTEMRLIMRHMWKHNRRIFLLPFVLVMGGVGIGLIIGLLAGRAM